MLCCKLTTVYPPLPWALSSLPKGLRATCLRTHSDDPHFSVRPVKMGLPPWPKTSVLPTAYLPVMTQTLTPETQGTGVLSPEPLLPSSALQPPLPFGVHEVIDLFFQLPAKGR